MKYIHRFSSAELASGAEVLSPAVVSIINTRRLVGTSPEGKLTITDDGHFKGEEPLPSKPANNEIWYTSSNNSPITFNNIGLVLGSSPISLISNEYNERLGKFILTFDGDISTLNDGAAYNKGAFYDKNKLTSIDFPESLTYIGNNTFYWCTGLTNVTYGDNITSIGDHAFYNCTSLKNIFIPCNVLNIGVDAFRNCTSATTIVVDENNTVYDSRNNCNAIIKTATNELLFGCKNTIIPNTVTDIYNLAFSYCTGLTNIVIPASIINIKESAFATCSSLATLTFSGNQITFTKYAFTHCSALTNLEIPDNSIVGNDCFGYCSKLTDLIIGNSVVVNSLAFRDCSSLVNVTFKSATSTGTLMFSNCTNLTNITFTGTIAEWNAASKATNWASTIAATVVHCSDGDATI